MRQAAFIFLFICFIGITAKSQTPAKNQDYDHDYFNMKAWEQNHPEQFGKSPNTAAIVRNLLTIKNLNHGVFKVPNNRSFYVPSELIIDHRPHARNMMISFTFNIR